MNGDAGRLAQVRREEQLRAECKLLRAIYRAARAFLQPDGSLRGLEATVMVYETWLAEPNAPPRGTRAARLRVAGGRAAR